MTEIVQKRIKEWSNPPFDEQTISEIKSLVSDEKELTDRFHSTLAFGTGGLRGVLGAGTNRMNLYTVGMATQGLANYINKKGRANNGVVISYDSRRMSDQFARDTAMVLAANGIKVYLFDDITPTPLCSYAIRELKAVSGIMITASHNPPEYNGYKCYWDDGCQVVPPDDTLIIDEVNKISSITMIKRIPFEEGLADKKIIMIGEDLRSSYIALLEKSALRKISKSDIKIAYTPLHGTGYSIIPRVLHHFGFTNLSLEPDQSKPDGNFPTVKSPNPEERETLERVVTLAKNVTADILLATDPDADRMGVGLRTKTGEYILLNGNQIGTMLEYYLLSRLAESKKIPSDARVVKTIVTTDLQTEVAAAFNVTIDEVLTGFKWIGLKMKEYEEKGSGTFIFGGEESFGYLPVPFVRDKDAVSACYFFCEMADWLSSKGKSLEDFLNEIYIRFALYTEDLASLTLKGIEGMERISRIIESFKKTPPTSIAGTAVIRMDNLSTLIRTNISDGSTTPITGLPKSDVVQLFLSDGSKITVRPSGTEPKIKFYFSLRKKVDADSLEKSKIELHSLMKTFREDLLSIVEKIQ